MQFKLPLTILASLALAQGFKVPADAQDGAYIVQTDESGQETLVLVEAMKIGVTGRRAEARAELKARDQNACAARSLNHGDTDAAVSKLRGFCGGGQHYPAPKLFYKVGSTVAYSCDYSGNQLCYSSEAELAFQQITRACGLYASGWWLFGSNKNYGYDDVNAEFCGNLH
ncbi:hypothetical protein KVR01_007160 [Diaporthe batatas]|uniref:uncharacterized protein n=1 Tax=Diaporthe batatas TaxID=748121 RepID=UPI001D046983|nr:uncharacterized protein KVR01_007160 [Diaporthe batatas]KAG8162682.1 hypothetical protein KVR01_007160 [Diaporthe batatas]